MSLKKGVLSHLGGLLNEAFDYDTYFAKLGTTRACLFFANLPLGDMNHNRLPRQAQDEHKHKFRPHKKRRAFSHAGSLNLTLTETFSGSYVEPDR